MPEWGTHAAPPSSPAAGHVDCRPQDLVLFLGGIWLMKPFLSGQQMTFKVSVYHSLQKHICYRMKNKNKGNYYGGKIRIGGRR